MQLFQNTPEEENRKRKAARHMIRVLLGAIGIFLVAAFVAYKISPWPSALFMRRAFTQEAEQKNKTLARYVPAGITGIRDQQYDSNDKDAFLDVYFPAEAEQTGKELPVIVWMHGGGFISGKKEHVANYCKILAGKGFTVVAINYSIAPEKRYPTPLLQLNAALAYLQKNAGRFHLDPNSFILAGNSGGAHIAAQFAAIISNAAYAKLLEITPEISRSQVIGSLLYCGPYDVNEQALQGDFGEAFQTFLWAYLGRKDFRNAPKFATIKVVNYMTANFPPAFISAGNTDPLLFYSQEFARKMVKLKVPADTLFFPENYKPALPHEYQFNLDSEAGKRALERSVNFINNLKNTPNAKPE